MRDTRFSTTTTATTWLKPPARITHNTPRCLRIRLHPRAQQQVIAHLRSVAWHGPGAADFSLIWTFRRWWVLFFFLRHHLDTSLVPTAFKQLLAIQTPYYIDVCTAAFHCKYPGLSNVAEPTIYTRSVSAAIPNIIFWQSGQSSTNVSSTYCFLKQSSICFLKQSSVYIYIEAEQYIKKRT